MIRSSTMIRIAFVAGIASAPLACQTSVDGSNPKESGTTVDNGRVAPSTIVLQYVSFGSGIDSLTKTKIDEVITTARDAGLLKTELEHRWGREGESTACVQFKSWQEMQAYRRQICLLIKDGNAATGMKLTSHQITQDCTPAVIEQPIEGNDTGCDDEPATTTEP